MKLHKKNSLRLVVGALITAGAVSATTASAQTIIHNTKSNGSPAFMTGELGAVNAKSAKSFLKSILAAEASYGFTGSEDFEVDRQWTDALGKSHIRFNQTINGLKVYGTSMTLHMNASANTLSASGASSISRCIHM